MEAAKKEFEAQKSAFPQPTHFWVWPLVIVLLLSSGILYRIVAAHLRCIVESPLKLPVPLQEFPMDAANWSGKDIHIPENIQKVAGNDDFLSRLYVNKTTNQWANIYVAYTARPRTMLGHRPQACYPANGWIHDSTEQIKISSLSGRETPCLLHRFHRPAPSYNEIVVLNFYILNGQITNDDSVFTGLGWRTPNINGNLARYVAQVQISSVFENSVRLVARDLTDLIMDFLPDKKSEVRGQKSEVRGQKSEVRNRKR